MKITSKQFAQGLYELVDGKRVDEVKVVVENFFKVLKKENQLGRVEEIIAEFIRIWNKEKGIVEAEIISAKKLDKESINSLSNYIAQLTSAKEIEAKEKVETNLLGGVVIKYGDKVVDGSVKTRLHELKKELVK